MSALLSPRLPSERRFGLVLAAAIFVLCGWKLFVGRSVMVYGAWLAVGAVLFILALAVPRSLAPLNKAWYHLGEWLGKIVSPIVLAIIFFGLLTPVALITRLFGRDELRLFRRSSRSYWVDCDARAPASDSFEKPY